jgi:hypothetical protein
VTPPCPVKPGGEANGYALVELDAPADDVKIDIPLTGVAGVAGLDRFWNVALDPADGVPALGHGAGNCPGIGFQFVLRPSL